MGQWRVCPLRKTAGGRMNRDIAAYVLGLAGRVTRRQQHVLLVLACHHQIARETYWPSREKLAVELDMDESQLRRTITELEAQGILQQTPGNGSGNHSGYIFVEFEKGDKKGDFFDPAIRNYKTFTDSKALEPTKSSTTSSDGESLGDIASSSVNRKDDDAKRVPELDRWSREYQPPSVEVDRVIRAFESNPVTVDCASTADRIKAVELLKLYPFEQIEYGLLLGSARKSASMMNYSGAHSKIQTLSYFVGAIEEVAGSAPALFPASYMEYLRNCLQKDAACRKQPQSESA
jgi:hypothetical protein